MAAEADGSYSMMLRIEGLPVDLVGEILGGLDRGARRAGYSAVFREYTGFGTVYFVPLPVDDTGDVVDVVGGG